MKLNEACMLTKWKFILSLLSFPIILIRDKFINLMCLCIDKTSLTAFMIRQIDNRKFFHGTISNNTIKCCR